MLTLYNANISTCSQKVRMALWEKGLEWQDRQMDLLAGEQLSDWYLAINPNGVVPTLVHDNTTVIDSSVINEYLEDVFPDTPLRPADPGLCAHMRAWRQFIDEVPTTAIRYPSFNSHFVSTWAGLSEEEFNAHTEKMPLRKHFYRQMGRTGFSQEAVNQSLERLRQTLERMERALAATRWLACDDLTLADISIMPTIVRMEDLGLAGMWGDLPATTDWFARIKSRPAFAKTYNPDSRKLSARN